MECSVKIAHLVWDQKAIGLIPFSKPNKSCILCKHVSIMSVGYRHTLSIRIHEHNDWDTRGCPFKLVQEYCMF